MKQFAMMWAPAAILGVLLAGCDDRTGSGDIAAPGNESTAAGVEQQSMSATGAFDGGAVYTISNDAAANSVLRFTRSAGGALVPSGSYPTGGTGSGAGLGSQGAIVLGERLLYAVNAGSNDISVLAFDGKGWRKISKVSSGGMQPISLTVHGDLLFALNAGGSGNISGFSGAARGVLSPLPGSTRSLSGPATQPAEVAFSPDGRTLVVTEKATNKIDTYEVGGFGRVFGPKVRSSAGDTPFGFAFSGQGALVVSEAADKIAGASTLSSYLLDHNRDLRLVSGQVPDGQTAACWVEITGSGRFAYTTNAGSNDVSGYRLGANGKLLLLGDGGMTATADGAPIDMALSRGSDFLYVLNSGGLSITGYRVNNANGSLTPVGKVGGLPASVSGLAAN